MNSNITSELKKNVINRSKRRAESRAIERRLYVFPCGEVGSAINLTFHCPSEKTLQSRHSYRTLSNQRKTKQTH